jgi:hypothetical protein
MTAFWDEFFAKAYSCSDNGHVVIVNKTFSQTDLDREQDDYPWAEIAYLEGGTISPSDGVVSASCGCLKPGWLAAAQRLAVTSGGNVTLSLSRLRLDSLQSHKIEITRDSARFTNVSDIASLLEKAQASNFMLKDVCAVFAQIELLIYTIKLE